MVRRPLLTEEERRLLFGVPDDPDALARHYTLRPLGPGSSSAGRRGDANRLGFAVQLALLRHPGMGLAQMEEPVDIAGRLAGGARLEHSGRRIRRVRAPAADDDRPCARC